MYTKKHLKYFAVISINYSLAALSGIKLDIFGKL